MSALFPALKARQTTGPASSGARQPTQRCAVCARHVAVFPGRGRRVAPAGRVVSARAGVTVGALAQAATPQVVTVPLGDRSYPIYIGRGLLHDGELLRRHVTGKSCLVVTNQTVAPLYLQRVVDGLSAGGHIRVATVVLRDGEQYKTLEEVNKVFDAALGARLDRGTTLVALGGGVVGDMTGFAAACYQRGVNFVQVPTTLMAMVDSSVGGKTGVNHALGKNMVGAFWQPQAVLCDTDALGTLPDRELASGVAEVIKYGLIRDPGLFAWLEANMGAVLARQPEALAHVVASSCVNKAAVVGADERETDSSAAGGRATLNLGHTFGHAIENGTGYGTWLHGEAVAIGTAMAADLSLRLGWVEPPLVARTLALLKAARLPTEVPADSSMTPSKFLALMAVDKKASDGAVRLILLKGPLGGCVFTKDYDAAALRATIDAFCRV